MPFQFRCGSCGMILMELENMNPICYYSTCRNGRRMQDAPITAFIKHKIGINCPQCGKKLAKKPEKIGIVVLEMIKK